MDRLVNSPNNHKNIKKRNKTKVCKQNFCFGNDLFKETTS